MSRNKWDNFGDDIERGPGAASWVVGKWVLIVLLIGLLISAIMFFVSKPLDVVKSVTQTDKILYNYEYFYNQAEAKKAIQRKIDAARGAVESFREAAGPRETWTFEDKTESARLSSIVNGLEYQCADIVADYNAKAQQVTRSIFKTESTPYRLTECN